MRITQQEIDEQLKRFITPENQESFEKVYDELIKPKLDSNLEGLEKSTNELSDEQQKLPKAFMELLSSMEEKYCDLVWYARKPTEGIGKIWEDNDWYKDMDEETVKSIRKSVKEIAKAFPAETMSLSLEYGLSNGSDWQHGFNSGMLAFTRLLSGLADEEEANRRGSVDCFPELDS